MSESVSQWLGIISQWLERMLPASATILGTAIGAFFGSFFAYLFGQRAERKRRTRLRWVQHRNALVVLEQEFNEQISIMADNRYLTELAINTSVQRPGLLPVLRAMPHILPVSAVKISDFLRTELMNELFSYHQKVRKFNNDMRNVIEAYTEMRGAKISNHLTGDQYLSALSEFQQSLRQIARYYDLIDDRILDLLARVRATLAMDSKFDERAFTRLPALPEVSEDEIANERTKLETEIEGVRASSRQELRRYEDTGSSPTSNT